MRKVNLQTQVLEALLNNAKTDRMGLTITQIAKTIFGMGYRRNTARELEQSVRNIMFATTELAANNGTTIFPVRKPTKLNPERKSRVLYWQVYNPDLIGCKEKLADDVIYRKRIGEAKGKPFKRVLNVAKETGAITEASYNEMLR
jgi:hypothetical protein